MTENEKKYKEVFLNSLSISEDKFSDKLEYNDISEWDLSDT